MNDEETISVERKAQLTPKQKIVMDVVVTSVVMLGGITTVIGWNPLPLNQTVGLAVFYMGARFFPNL